MRVLVIGSKGQLGRSLLERAARSRELEVVGIGRPEIDLELPGSAAAAISGVAPAVVVNAAAYTLVDQAEDEPERAFRINAYAAAEIAVAARDSGARLIHVSTDYVFGGAADEPYREDFPPNPLGVYGRSKLEGEEQVRVAASDHMVIRTAWLYSPFRQNFVKTIVNATAQRDVVAVVDDQRGSPTSALDVADGILVVLGRWSTGDRLGVGDTYHLAGTGDTSWFGFAQAVMAECARRRLPTAEVRPIPSAEWPTRAERPRYSVLDSGKFERDFGYRARPWPDSLAAIIGRLAEQPQPAR